MKFMTKSMPFRPYFERDEGGESKTREEGRPTGKPRIFASGEFTALLLLAWAVFVVAATVMSISALNVNQAAPKPAEKFASASAPK